MYVSRFWNFCTFTHDLSLKQVGEVAFDKFNSGLAFVVNHALLLLPTL